MRVLRSQAAPSGSGAILLWAGVYNRKSSNLRKARAALAAARSGGRVMNIACVGDSITRAANYPLTMDTDSYPARLNALMAARGETVAGEGYVGLGSLARDARVVDGGTPFSANRTNIASSTVGASVIVTSNEASTVVHVVFLRVAGQGTININIDGVDKGNFSTAGATSYGVIQAFTGLPDTTHVVTLTVASGANSLQEVGFLRPSGVVASSYGESGMTASTIYADSANMVTGPVPDLSIILSETNDQSGGSGGVASYITNITNLVTQARTTGDAIIATTVRPQTPNAALPQYDAALYALADSLDVPLIDHGDVFGPWTAADAAGLMYDALHPSKAGYELMADTTYRAIFG